MSQTQRPLYPPPKIPAVITECLLKATFLVLHIPWEKTISESVAGIPHTAEVFPSLGGFFLTALCPSSSPELPVGFILLPAHLANFHYLCGSLRGTCSHSSFPI